MSVDEHPFIRFLAYAADRPSFRLRDAYDHAGEGFQITPDESSSIVKATTDSGMYRLRPAYVVHYLEYVELKEARQSAAEAKRQARHALIVAIVAIIISIATSVAAIALQMYRPVEVIVVDDRTAPTLPTIGPRR